MSSKADRVLHAIDSSLFHLLIDIGLFEPNERCTVQVVHVNHVVLIRIRVDRATQDLSQLLTN